MKASPQIELEVRALMDRFAERYVERDIEGLMACLAPDADTVFYGTGKDEKRIGAREIRQQAERDWAQTDSIALKFDWSSISAAGDVAWAAVDGGFDITAGGEHLLMPARASFVFEKREGSWLVAHAHFSVPAAGQEEGSSI